jgi:TonB family protein
MRQQIFRDILVRMRRRNCFTLTVCVFSVLFLWAQASAFSREQKEGTQDQPAASAPGNIGSTAGATDQTPQDSKSLELVDHPLVYPSEAKEKGIQGKVVVKVSVLPTGAVESVEAVSGDPILTKAAVEAVKEWTFKPFIRNGKAIGVVTNLPVNFALPAQPRPTNVEPAKIVSPVYPKNAEAEENQGQVVIRAFINEIGDVEKSEVVDSTDTVFNQSALDAVKQWKFKPYMEQGKAIPVVVRVPVDFALPDQVVDKRAWSDEYSKDELPPGVPRRVRVQSRILTGAMIHQVLPVYPWQAKKAHIEGLVIFNALISREGRIEGLRLISGDSPFVKPAIGAVRQWRYEPYLLNGESVEVDTQIEVHFNLAAK